MTNKRVLLTVSLVFILAVATAYLTFYQVNIGTNHIRTQAGSSSKTLDTEAEWAVGTNVNTKLNSPSGSVGINAVTESAYDLSEYTLTGHVERNDGMTPYGSTIGLPANIYDNDTTTGWSFVGPEYLGDSVMAVGWVDIDFGSVKHISKIRLYPEDKSLVDPTPLVIISTSNDNISYAPITLNQYPDKTWSEETMSQDTRYLRIQPESNSAQYGIYLNELQVYTNHGLATHTSASTQIDGTATISGWNTFAPSATIPANTSINFRFRTSPDGSDWSSPWSASTPYAGSIDISGQPATNRYMQVESTLENTDGTSTPTLDSYTVNYTTADATPTPTPTATPTATLTATATPTATSTNSPTSTPTATQTSTAIPTPSPTPTLTPNTCYAQCEAAIASDLSENDQCVKQEECLHSCGADQFTLAKINNPNGGESFSVGSEMPIDWQLVDGATLTPKPDVKVPTILALSIDGGSTYTNQIVLMPKDTDTPLSTQEYLNQANVSAYGYFGTKLIDGRSYFDYMWRLPVNARFITPLARIRLEPIRPGCTVPINSDTSDADFSIIPLAKSISVYLSPEKRTIKPSQTGTFTANAYNELGQLINDEVSFNFELKTGGAEIVSTNGSVLTIRAGTSEFNYPNSIKVTASYNTLSSFYYASFRVSSQTPVMDRVVMEPALQTVDQNASFTYHALVLDQFGEIFPDATIDWSLLEPSAGTLVPLPNDPSRAVFTGTRPGCYSYIIKAVASANGISYFDIASVRVKAQDETIPTAFDPFMRLTKLAINS